MRFLVVDTYYVGFTADFFAARPHLQTAPYAEQLSALMEQHFGTADYYSTNLRDGGHDARDVVSNCEPLQRAWAREHGVPVRDTAWRLTRAGGGGLPRPRRVARKEWLWSVLAAQIREYKPDVLHVHDMNGMPRRFLREVRPYVRLITGQIASEIAPGADFGEYDLVLSSFPHFVERFRGEGLRSEYFQLGFEPRVLDLLAEERSEDLVFIGGLSANHASRIEFLESLAHRCPIAWWGYGVDLLPDASPLRHGYRGPAWGKAMYQRLASARVALNVHVDTAGPFANNMRLYEATGVGSFLLTDRKRNLADIFIPGREVVDYGSLEECAELAIHFLAAGAERESIARAGQARTLASHTYRHRMEEFASLVKPLLPARRGAAVPEPSR